MEIKMQKCRQFLHVQKKICKLSRLTFLKCFLNSLNVPHPILVRKHVYLQKNVAFQENVAQFFFCTDFFFLSPLFCPTEEMLPPPCFFHLKHGRPQFLFVFFFFLDKDLRSISNISALLKTGEDAVEALNRNTKAFWHSVKCYCL